MITPLEKDFDKMTRADIEDMFSQVCMAPGAYKEINEYLKSKYRSHD